MKALTSLQQTSEELTRRPSDRPTATVRPSVSRSHIRTSEKEREAEGGRAEPRDDVKWKENENEMERRKKATLTAWRLDADE